MGWREQLAAMANSQCRQQKKTLYDYKLRLEEAEEISQRLQQDLEDERVARKHLETQYQALQSTLIVRETEIKELTGLIARLHAMVERDTERACMDAEDAKARKADSAKRVVQYGDER